MDIRMPTLSRPVRASRGLTRLAMLGGAAALVLASAPAQALDAAAQYRQDVAYCQSSAVEADNRARCLFEAQAAKRRNEWQDKGRRNEDGQAMHSQEAGGSATATSQPASPRR